MMLLREPLPSWPRPRVFSQVPARGATESALRRASRRDPRLRNSWTFRCRSQTRPQHEGVVRWRGFVALGSSVGSRARRSPKSFWQPVWPGSESAGVRSEGPSARNEIVRSVPARVRAAVLVVVLVVGAVAGARVSAGGGAAPPKFSHVVVIVFENKEFEQVIGSAEAPTLGRLANRYVLLTNYRAVAHPSLPNYLALVSGSTQGVTSDCSTCTVDASNLADSIEEAGKTWKTYAEGLPRAGYTGATSGRYAKKHNPFLYFADVGSDSRRLRRIVPLSAFRRDLTAARLPDFALVVPDLCHDMHDCPVAAGDAWLDSFLRPLLHSAAFRKGVVFVVFDESVATDTAGGGGHVPALVLGPLVRPGSRDSASLDHYSVLRTIEQSWQLPLLGNSA